MTIRPQTPAETALYVQMRERPNIIIFPPQGEGLEKLIIPRDKDAHTKGRIVITEDLREAGATAVLAILEWARLSMLKYYGLEDSKSDS